MKSPVLVGIVNITPDSFSGDGRQGSAAISHARALIDAGAGMLDLGAESTRPGAGPITAEEEWERLSVFFDPKESWNVPFSIDTRHAQTAVRALEYGVHAINDVGGLKDPAMLEMLGRHSCDIIAMHSLTLPADKAIVWPETTDPLQEILRWKNEVTTRAESHGIIPGRLIFDPGIGFGKSPPQSLALVTRAAALKASGGRWLFGHSRKSFLSLFGEAAAHERDALTLAFSLQLAQAKVDYLRVHNIAAHRTLFPQLCM